MDSIDPFNYVHENTEITGFEPVLGGQLAEKAVDLDPENPDALSTLSLSYSIKKDYAKNKLARFKIPKNIYIINEIPVGATGKIQRIGLAKKLGIE